MKAVSIFVVLFSIIRIEIIPIAISCGLQYYICRNYPKNKKIIPIIMIILGAFGFVGLLLMSQTLMSVHGFDAIILLMLQLTMSFLPLIAVLFVTHFTKEEPSIKKNEMKKMKINDL